MLNRFLGNLRIVVAETPYDTLHSRDTQEIFSQAMALKIEGYRSVYPYGVLPVDTYDFVSTHHFVCRDQKILMGYKSVTWARCEMHQLPFPGLSLLHSSSALPQEKALSALLDQHLSHREQVTYGSSWTISPEARKNPVLKTVLKELMAAMLVHHEEELGSTARFCCGVPHVKTHDFFQNLGYAPITGPDGKALPAFKQSSLLGEEAVMLQCTRFSEEAHALAGKYQEYWDERQVIGTQESSIAEEGEAPKKEAA